MTRNSRVKGVGEERRAAGENFRSFQPRETVEIWDPPLEQISISPDARVSTLFLPSTRARDSLSTSSRHQTRGLSSSRRAPSLSDALHAFCPKVLVVGCTASRLASRDMFIPSYLYRSAYDLILDRTRGRNSCSTYLLVAPEVDAVCAARLLSSLLKTDDVQHLTIPVGSWAELDVEARKLRELPDGDVSSSGFGLQPWFRARLTFLLLEQVRNLVMIGFGASADLYALFAPRSRDDDDDDDQEEEESTSLEFSHECMIHVLDAHRPVNLRNLFEHAPQTETYFQKEKRRLAAGGGGGGRWKMQDEFSVVVWNEVRPRNEEDGAYARELEAWRALEVRCLSYDDEMGKELTSKFSMVGPVRA